MIKKKTWLFFLVFPFILSCSTTPEKTSTNEKGALASYNRKIYRFNRIIDKRIFKPVAQSHKKFVPKPIADSISNFFSNLNDVTVMTNNFLQFKFEDGITDFGRIAFNSTLGFGGFLDIASEMGLEKHDEDFGQTLASWGVKSGPYIVLPFLGPSTIRDATGDVADYLIKPSFSDKKTRITAYLLEKLDKRVNLLSSEKVIEGLSTDEYTLIRDAWVQNRAFKIKDGKVENKVDSELKDELKALDNL